MTKRITISLLVIICMMQHAKGQKKEKVESATPKSQSYKEYKLKSADKNADDILEEANKLKYSNPEQALINVQEALGQSIAQRDDFNEGRCYMLLGEINENIREWNLALENYTRAYLKLSGLSAKQDNRTELLRVLKGLGDMNLKLGHFPKALQYYEQSLSVRLNNKERNERQLDISEVYYQMGRYTEAQQAIAKIETNKKISDPALESRIQNQQAKIYAQLNDLDNTKQSFSNSINSLNTARSTKATRVPTKENDVSKKDELPEEQAFQESKEEIANVLRGQGRYDDEIDLRNKSIEYNIESKNFKEVTKDKLAISKALEAKGETSAAIRELEEAARIADTINNPKVQANAYLALADLYEKNDRNPQAISAYKKYSASVSRQESLSEKQLSEKANLIKIQKDIEEVSKNVSIGQREETIEKQTVFRQQLIIYGLLLIICIAMITSYFIYKNAQASKVANQLLALKSLRSQMNPHFIFNALNSVNHFIAQQDERTANRFLSEFSQLMRLVLENSREDFISLQKEHEILSLYLKLEHYRFRDKFDYEIKMDDDINTDAIPVPPMLIQPYIENAVWHGLRYKESKGNLLLHFRKEGENLLVEITDDGIGRKRSFELKTENQKKHTSTGLKNIQERLSIINKVYKTNYRVTIEDRGETSGTRVLLYLPFIKGIDT